MAQRPLILVILAIVVAGVAGVIVGVSTMQTSGPAATPSSSAPTTEAAAPTRPGPRAKVYVVGEGKAPLLVEANYPLIGDDVVVRVASRIDALRAAAAPSGYANPYARSTVRLMRVTNDEPTVVTLWFTVANDDWGVGPDQARLLLQQLVWTVTEEPGITIVRILQNQGLRGGANIAGTPANYEMMRKTFP